MAEKKSWRDYSKNYSEDNSTDKTATEEKTGTWRDYSQSHSSGNTAQSGKASGGWRDYSTVDTGSIVGSNVVNRVNNWLKNHNDYISSYQSRYSGRKGSYEDAYVSDSADWLETVKSQKSNFDAEADGILSYMEQYKDYLDADWMNEVKTTLLQSKSTQNKVLNSSIKDNMYWESWGSEELVKEYGSAEDAYKASQLINANTGKSTLELDEILANMEDGKEKEWLTSYRGAVDYDEMSKMDTQLLQGEIDEMETVLEEAESIVMNYGFGGQEADDDLTTQIRELIGGYSNGAYYWVDDLKAAIAAKRQRLSQAQRIQNGIKLAGVADSSSDLYDPEFTQYANYSGGKIPLIPDYKDLVYGIINGDQDAKNGISMATAWRKLSDDEGSRLDAVQHMTNDEKALYNYYYNKQGYKAAEEYLDSIIDKLNAQHGAEMFKALENKPVLELVFSTAAGLDQFNSGIKNLFSTDDYIPTSSTQYASGLVREDLKDVDLKYYNFKEGQWDDAKIFGSSLGQSMYDLGTTTANMAPSILVSSLVGTINPAAGAVVGNTLMGASAAGNAYQEVLNQGYGKAEARMYSTAVGVSESILQYALGGIGKLGGASSKIAKAVEGIDSGLLRFSLQYGGKFASEAIEEGLQEVLDPVFKNAILHTDEDVNWSEVAYSALLGGLSAGVFEGVPTAVNVANEQKLKKEYGGKTDSLINQGLQNDVNSESYQLAQQYKAKTDAGKTLTGAQIRNLLAANKEAITSNDLKKIQQAAENRLTELGQTEDVSKIAELATKFATGQTLTRAEKSILAKSEYGSRVSNELLPKNILSEGYTTGWAEEIGTESVNKVAYNKKQISELLEKMATMEDSAAYKSLEDRVGTETTFKTSEDGQATISKTGETIDLGKAEVAEFIKDKKGNIVDMVIKADGKEVKASEVDYADGNQSYLFEAVSKIENITPRAATAIVRDYDPSSGQTVGEYLNGIDEGFTYGYYGYTEADLKAGNFAPKLTDTQMKSAYVLGQDAKKSSDTSKADSYKRMRTAAEAQAEKAVAEGKEAPKAKNLTVTYDRGNGDVVSIDDAGIRDAKRSGAVEVAKILHKMGLGTKVEFFKSELSKTLKDEKGNAVRVFFDANGVEKAAPSGVYRKSDGTIRVDLNAYNGRGLTLNALSHELTHFIQQWSEEKYKVLADFLIKAYEKTDMTMHERVLKEQARLEGIRGEKVSYDEAFDEVVANAMSKMFDDGKLVERLTELKAQDEKLARKLWQGFKKILAKFIGVYENAGPLFKDTADIMAMKETFEQLQNMFAEAMVEASENYQASLTVAESQTINEAGIGFDEDTRSVYSLHFSTAYSETIQVGKKTFDTEAIAQVVAKGTGRSIEDARKWVKSELTIANMVMANPEFLDFEADNRYDAIKKNSDYPQGTVDLSNLCPKREEFTAMFDMLQKKYPNKLFTAQDIADMRKILAKNDITVACGACFVEDRRQLICEIADTFIGMWKEAVESGKPLQKTNAEGKKSDLLVTKALAKQYGLTAGTKIMATDTYIPNQYDLTTYEGFKLLEKNHPTIAMSFNRYNNSRGQQSARLIEGRAEYKRQILGWSDAKVRSVNNNGGLRIFSFSDFEVVHLLDLVQVIIDCAAKGVKIQGYTKIPAFAKLVRGTGIKLNRSLIPKGDYGFHMENGKVVLDYDTVEGVDINDKNFIDESDNPNVGNIVIGINPTQIGAAMLDSFIDYIIPFHSNKAKEILKKLGTGEWVNYKESQHEKDISTGKASKHNVNIYTEVINKYHPQNKVEFVNAFLTECKRQGKIPRYAEFLNVDSNGDYVYREGYHKLLVDFKMFDAEGNILPQESIIPKLDEAFMKELLNAEIDKKQNYEFPQEVYDDIDKQFGEQYSSQDTDVDGYNTDGFKDYDIVSAVYTIRNEKAKRRQDLVKIGNMPKLYRDLFALDGDVFVSNEHLYQNMVSRDTAIAEGRYKEKTDNEDGADYHELGEKKVINAIEQFQDPLVIMESLKDFKEPRLVAILEEKGNDGENLIAVLELYSKQRAYGSEKEHSHVLITIYEKSSLPDYVGMTAKKGRVMHIKNGVSSDTLARLQLSGDISKETLKKNVARFNKKVKTFKEKNNIQYSSQETDADNAPTFYSKMGKVVDGMKQEKFGASSVISMLRGRGVKAEEIRWSGIQAFLDGKKSVTKQELLDFINGSMLQIEEESRTDNKVRTEYIQAWKNFVDQDLDEREILDGLNNLDEMESYLESLVEDEDLDRYYADYILRLAHEVTNSKDLPTKWSQYKLEGGENYREIVFKMPGATYTNTAMQTHWGEDAKGVLAHARIQDFNTFIGKMLFIEEIQSDWHNAGHKVGYRKEGEKTDNMLYRESEKAYEEFYAVVEKMVYDNADWEDDNAVYYAHPVAVAEMFDGNESYFEQYGFTDKQIETIRTMVAEESARKEALKTAPNQDAAHDAPFKDNYHEYVLKRLIRMASEESYDSVGWTTAETQDERWQNNLPHKEGTGKSGFLEGYRIEYDQKIKNFLAKFGKQWDSTVSKTTLDNGTEVWSMAITDSMKNSVLKDGQEMYSSQETDSDFLADGKIKGNYTVTEISKMFDAWNSDPELTDLSKMVFSKLQEIVDEQKKAYWATPYPIRFKSDAYLQKVYYISPNGIFEPSSTDGNYGITYNLDYFRKTSDQDKARVLLHEAIHACTVGAIKSAERRIPKQADPMEFTPGDDWSDAQKAALELIQVFSQVRVANERNEYGQKNVYEMVAEMSNPEFRTMLKKERLWNRIVDAIKRIFGIEQRTAYDAVSNALEKILELDMTKADNVQYSEHETDYSNRSLLANAFEGITNGSVEYKMIQEYKGHIAELNSLENKLSEFNREIRKIRFGTEGQYDAEKLRRLETEAKKIAEAINRHDSKLVSLEASAPLRRLIERERKKEAQKTKEHVKEIQQNKKARAEQTELRHKIRRTVRDLDKILNRANKKQNVKEDMKGFVSKALELADYLFTDHVSNDDLIRKGITVRMTQREAALVKETEDILSQLYDNADSLTDEEFARLDAKRKANEDKLRDLLTAQRNERLNTPVYNLFNDLVTEYASLKNSKQEAVKGAYDPKVEEFLRSYLGETADGTDSDRKILLQNMRVADMTTEELWKLHNAYTMVLHSVRQANSLFVKGKTESIEQMAGRIMSDFSKRKAPDGKVATVIRNLSNKMGWDYEKLYYALDRIGSESFTELVMNLADAENTVMQDIMEAVAFRDEIVKKYGFNNWKVNKEIDKEFLDTTGKKFKMTLGQLMSLYAYSRREGAWDHIEYGGFVFGETALTNPKPADSYKLSKAQCEAITNTLTKEQKGYVEDMQKFLSETMGAKGNEVSMLLYGINMFGEKNYFPIHIAGQFKAQANESQAKAAAGFGTMTNAGFTHAQNPNAKAPFVLEGFNEIWADHVNEMSRYHGTVPALEDMRRVMNRSSYSEADSESMSIKQMMENSFGKDAVAYFDNLYREANSGAITDKLQKTPKKLLSLFRKNSVAYSLSVIIQQPSAMVRAYAMIDPKYFGFKGVGALTSGVAKAVSSKWNPAYANAYNEMMKYAPGVTMAKEIGGFDTHTGSSIREYLLDTGKSFKQSMKTENLKGKGKAVLDLVDDNAIANLPSVADKIAWIEIWNACKRETVAKHKDLATNSEEFMQAVGERFTEVIRATQVYDSIFAKSPMLKSKALAVQYLVSFMNEPNTTANMAEKAVRDATKGDWKGGLRIAGAVTYSIIFNNVLKAIVYAMRDDDEDETYIEKYLAAVAGGMMDDFNALNYIPIVRDVWSKARGFDVERPDMAIITDAYDAYQAIAKVKGKDTEGMTEEELAELDKKVTDASWKLIGSLAAFFGIPVKNIYREIDGVIDHARIASANAGMTTASGIWDKVKEEIIDAIPFVSAKETKTDKLYDAIISGDTKYLERMKGTYKTEDAYQTAVRKALRENDPRIHEAAQARYDGKTEEYKRIFREIQKEGKFSFDDIMSAVNSEESKIRNKLEPEKATSDYTANGYVEAIAMGNTTDAVAMKDDIIATKVANGMTQEEAEKEFKSSVATGVGEAYSSGLLDEAQAEKMLVEYAGKDEEEAASKVSYWSYLDAHPEYEQYNLSESNVKDYLEFAEPAEIPMDVYVQFRDGTKGLAEIKDEWGDVEVTKREQVLEVIDSLPLTWQQKDALYLAAGYSESKIWDVPW